MTTQAIASGEVGLGRGGRMSRQRKRDAVLRLLRGEDLETDLTETVACSEARGFVEEEIECRLCGRTWRRRTRD